jgi:hypothetical protein
MTFHSDIEHLVIDVVVRSPGCNVEDVVRGCPELTWNQVFLEVDRLSRSGQLVLKQTGPGFYTVTLNKRAPLAAIV